MKKESIAIIGLGKVGTALGFLLRSAGHEIIAVSDASPEALRKGVEITGGKSFHDSSLAASMAETIFITVWDDAIESVCNEICESGAVHPKNRVVHVSGAGGLDLLEAAKKSGAFVASIHPLQSFADTEGAIENIPGSTFGITSQEEIAGWAAQIVKDLGGTSFFVSERDKPLYHAAACIASNYLITLMNIVEEMYKSIGFSDDKAIKAFWPLVKGTVKNIENKGTAPSLTGPISRGDIGTIKKHLRVFQSTYPALLNLYKEMGIFTVNIGLSNKTLSEEKAEEIKSLLRKETNNE
jgi:predicted short-subunit dehydrogenase-like oxidoreductase (DUF2520 family)